MISLKMEALINKIWSHMVNYDEPLLRDLPEVTARLKEREELKYQLLSEFEALEFTISCAQQALRIKNQEN